jgi:hypothetical protein
VFNGLAGWLKQRLQDAGNFQPGGAGHGPAVSQIAQQVPHAVQQFSANPGAAYQQAGQALQGYGNHLAQNPQHNFMGYASRDFLGPMLSGYGQTAAHFGQGLQGQNPYHGSAPQVIGQVGQDALNVASLFPAIRLGRLGLAAAEGGLKGLGAKIGQSALINGGYGAGYGATGAMQQQGAKPLDVLKAAGIGGAAGAGLGVATPLAGAAARGATRGAINVGRAVHAQGEGGFIAGPKATGFIQNKAIKAPDRMPRMEVSDNEAAINRTMLDKMHSTAVGKFQAPLSEVLGHPALYEKYPELASMPVVTKHLPGEGSMAAYDTGKGIIAIDPKRVGDSEAALKTTLLHEIQHAIQTKEGFAPGGNYNAIYGSLQEQRAKLLGQVDTFNTQLRNEATKNRWDYKGSSPLYQELLSKRQAVVDKILKLEGQWGGGIGLRENAHTKYSRTAGEAEARAVSNRQNYTQAELNSGQYNLMGGKITRPIPGGNNPYDTAFTGIDPKQLVVKPPIKPGEKVTASLEHPGLDLNSPILSAKSKQSLAKLDATEAKTEQLLKQQGVKVRSSINGEDRWTRPLPDTGPRPPITAKDIHGNIPKEGDTIRYQGVLGGEGTTKVQWAGPYQAKASGKKFPGQWLGNGILNGSRLPFEIVKGESGSADLGANIGGGKPPTGPRSAAGATPEPGGQPSQFTTRMKQDQRIPAKVRKDLTGNYGPITNADTLKAVTAKINADPEGSLAHVLGKDYKPTTNDHAMAMLLAEQARKEGNYGKMSSILQRVGEEAHSPGQAVQILSQWGKTTPEGLVKYAQRIAKSPLPDAQAQHFAQAMEQINKMPEGRDKLIATAQLMKEVANVNPTGAGDKLRALLYYAQLLNPKTAIRNVGGNSIFGAAENVSDAVAAPLDAVKHIVTGKPRSVYMPDLMGQFKAGVMGAKDAAQESVKGVNLSGMGGQTGAYAQRATAFNNPVGRTLDKTMALELSVPDRFAYSATEFQSLKNQLRAAGAPSKLLTPENIRLAKEGKDVGLTMTPDMLERASQLGKYRTFQDDSIPATVLMNLKKGLNIGQSFGAGNFALNYPKTPGNLLARGLDYSPAGFIKTAIDIAKVPMGKDVPPGTITRDLSRALVGQVGLVGTGAALNQLGVITGRPDPNKNVTAAEKALGLGQYKINVSALKRLVLSGFDSSQAKLKAGDTLVSYDWAQPLAFSLTMGANFNETKGTDKGLVGKISASLGKGAGEIVDATNSLAEQPVVQNLTKLGGNGAGLAQGALQVATSAPASFIPTILNQINQLTNNTTRSTYDPSPFGSMGRQVLNKIPGLSENLQPQIGPLGQPNERYQGGSNNAANVFLNPAFVSHYQPNQVLDEASRLQGSTGSTGQFPKIVANNQTVNGQNIRLSPKQVTDLQKFVGTTAATQLPKIISDPGYQAASDTDKAKILTNALSDASSAGKKVILGDLNTTSTNTNKIGAKGQLQAAKDAFDSSGKNYQIVGGNVLTRNAQGTVIVTPKIQYDYEVGAATLINQKSAGNYSGWMQTAQGQLSSIQSQLQDPSVDPLNQLKLQNDASTLISQMQRNSKYGGFTKGKSIRISKGNTPTAKNLSLKVATPKAPHYKVSGSGIKLAKSRSVKVKSIHATHLT